MVRSLLLVFNPPSVSFLLLRFLDILHIHANTNNRFLTPCGQRETYHVHSLKLACFSLKNTSRSSFHIGTGEACSSFYSYIALHCVDVLGFIYIVHC